MPVLAGRTREQIRVSIGFNLMGPRFIVSTTTRAGGDANSLIDRVRLFGGNDTFNGRWARATSGTNDGEVRRVTDFDQGTLGADAAGSHDATLATGFGATVPTSMGYELWLPEFPPDWVEDLINQAIMEAYGRAYDPEEDTSLHTGGDLTTFTVPTALDVVQDVYFREWFDSVEVHALNRLFDETTDADFTQLGDVRDFRRGAQSLRLTVAAAGAAGDFVTDSITSVNLRDMTHLEGWIKSTIVLAAADWVVRLDNGVVQGNATDLEILSVPAAATALLWTPFSVALATPHLDNAIVSVGLEMNVDGGAQVTWFDDLRATNQNTAVWTKLHRSGWSLDQEAGTLVLAEGARDQMGYALLKLKGGGAPVLLAADATVSELSAWWLICRATELAFQGATPPHGSGDRYQAQAVLWGERGRKAYKGLNRMRGARARA